MSRLPLASVWEPTITNSECFFFDDNVPTAVTASDIRTKTAVDPILSRVLDYCVSGWPSQVDSEFAPYHTRRNELCVEQGCVLWGSRVLVPPVLHKLILQELHETHPGMSRMKALARSYVWWAGLDKDIELTVSECQLCQSLRADPPKADIHPWIFPKAPWSRIHIDYAGPVSGHMYLVVVDAYSKFPEMVRVPSTTSTATIKVLRDIFSRFGLCDILVSDNAPQFVSEEFETFCSSNGIMHKTSAVYKPASNGQAERVVQNLKNALKQAELSNKDVDQVLAHYLLVYRNTPHATTGESPAMLLMGRRLRTRLDLLKPHVRSSVALKQDQTRFKKGVRDLCVEENVQFRNYAQGPKWKQGTVTKILGPRNYVITDHDGVTNKRHIDQVIVNRASDSSVNDQAVVQASLDVELDRPESVPLSSSVVPEVAQVQGAVASEQKSINSSSSPVACRYPIRSSRGRLPVKFCDFSPS